MQARDATRHLEEILVSGDEDVGFRPKRRGDDDEITPISEVDIRKVLGHGLHVMRAKQGLDLIDHRLGEADLPLEGAPQLDQDGFAGDEFVVGHGVAEHVGTEPAGSKRSHQDVGIEEDPQETSAKMSSSERYPLASAKGMTCLRRVSNARSDN